MLQREIRLIGGAAIALALMLSGACASQPRADRPVASLAPGIALPSSNAVLLGAVSGAEASRNDVHMGSPTPSTIVIESIDREWYQRDRILFGRTYRDARFTTRVRERSAP